MRAPVDGRVMTLRASAVGEAIGARDPILDIVPTQEKLVVEARIRPQDINHVREQSTADVRLSGFDARTTLESAARFRRVNPDLPILGVEIEKERVLAALPYADDKTFFRLGGFNLPLQEGEHVRLIRAFNVLRQYEEQDFVPAYERLAGYVLPGGLMIEGTSTPYGQIWCANIARKGERGKRRDRSVEVRGAGVQHELPAGVRHYRFPGGAAEEPHPSRGAGRTCV